MDYKITYYDRRVFDEIMGWSMSFAAKYVALTERIQKFGPNLGMPYTKSIG